MPPTPKHFWALCSTGTCNTARKKKTASLPSLPEFIRTIMWFKQIPVWKDQILKILSTNQSKILYCKKSGLQSIQTNTHTIATANFLTPISLELEFGGKKGEVIAFWKRGSNSREIQGYCEVKDLQSVKPATFFYVSSYINKLIDNLHYWIFAIYFKLSPFTWKYAVYGATSFWSNSLDLCTAHRIIREWLG